MAAPIAPAGCAYADLISTLVLVDTRQPLAVPPESCSVEPEYRVRVERRGLGIAGWIVAEVCAGHAMVATDLPGFLGRPWRISRQRVST